MNWAVCSYRGTLLHIFETFSEAFNWVARQDDVSKFYIREAEPEVDTKPTTSAPHK